MTLPFPVSDVFELQNKVHVGIKADYAKEVVTRIITLYSIRFYILQYLLFPFFHKSSKILNVISFLSLSHSYLEKAF